MGGALSPTDETELTEVSENECQQQIRRKVPCTLELVLGADSGPCFPGEFECYSERCLPASWRCNGRVECLGVGDELGSDEDECDSVSPEPPIDDVCGGYLDAFYGSFAPPAQTGQPVECVWTVDPQDSRPLKLELQQLDLGPRDTITITDQSHGTGNIIKTINDVSNNKAVEVESHTGFLSLIYHMEPSVEGRGFNATYRIKDYCLPWEELCGGSMGGCYSAKQRCDGHWDCPETGLDEEGCWGCPAGHFLCGMGGIHQTGRPVCFSIHERCNYQLNCADGTDERECTICQPGTFHCDSDSMFAPITRQEAELIQQQAPPSYGQLIAQGIIPPVEDFPTENPNETVSLSLRGILQLLRQDNASSLRRRRRPRCGRANENYRFETCLGVIMPDEHLNGCAVYPHPEHPDPTVLKPEGTGVADTDFLLYVFTHSTDKCRAESSILAYAAHCQTDSEGRPLAGTMIICRETLSMERYTHEHFVQTVIHELFHVLGFSKDLFGRWKDCSLSSQAGIDCWSHGQLTSTDEMGQARLYSPTVIREMQKHLNSTHTDLGAPLENKDAGSDGLSSHWEARVLQGSIMAALLVEPSLIRIDPITLAALQDTGWYSVNLSRAQSLVWGEGEGHQFGSVSTCHNSTFFCTDSGLGCHYLHFHKGECVTDQYLDGCHIFKPLANASECWKEENERSGLTEGSGEIYGSDSRCFISNLTRLNNASASAPVAGHCYRHRCTGINKYQIQVMGSDWLDCPAGKSIEVSGYEGFIFCPDNRICKYSDLAPTTSRQKAADHLNAGTFIESDDDVIKKDRSTPRPSFIRRSSATVSKVIVAAVLSFMAAFSLLPAGMHVYRKCSSVRVRVHAVNEPSYMPQMPQTQCISTN
ncbi:leishmanolysin-like peptidase isoform X1 [Labeo rohita]|uniref:Leishmanolysin-like peptidase n=1 Tax=Labeo rohita TaxID=84645 RepID=A0A498MJQ4_LABRO|nr:leishmanolysin-like peptidase isoform X1 [Labeo rohita]